MLICVEFSSEKLITFMDGSYFSGSWMIYYVKFLREIRESSSIHLQFTE
jgi:hypothetical protein